MVEIAYLAVMLHFSFSKGVQRDQHNIAAGKKENKKESKCLLCDSLFVIFGSLSV